MDFRATRRRQRTLFRLNEWYPVLEQRKQAARNRIGGRIAYSRGAETFIEWNSERIGENGQARAAALSHKIYGSIEEKAADSRPDYGGLDEQAREIEHPVYVHARQRCDPHSSALVIFGDEDETVADHTFGDCKSRRGIAEEIRVIAPVRLRPDAECA